jgi:serine-type D-Ala-D-Ala carboxypeptidase/endopeptidase
MNRPCLTFFCTALIFPMATLAADPPTAGAGSNAAVRDLGRQWLEASGGVGLSIGIYDKGSRQFYNFGTTRIDGGTRPTKDTVYEIGSLSKTLTAQLLARAVIEGRASLTDEAAKYLPEPYPNLANSGESIRLVHLVNMTSQLADNIPDLTQVRAVPGEPLHATYARVVEKYSREEFLRQLHRVVPRRAPGIEPAQSNVACMLLGVVLEKIYGEGFDAILAREIEKPLRMGRGTQPNAKLLARGYTAGNEELPPFTATMAWTWGSLRYSTDDLLRFAAWQMVERDASVKLAHQPTWSMADGAGPSVAMYWIHSETPLGRRLYFSGGSYGFSSAVELFPDAQLALVLLSNRAADGAQETLRALSAKIVEELRPEPLSRPQPAGAQPADQ